MSISAAILAARSGLQVTSQKAEIVATNVANASTPGYVRRSLVVGELVNGSQTAGVMANGVARAGDDAIKAQRRELTSDVAQATVLASTWQTISQRVGNTSSGGGLFRSFSNFETALSAAVTSPESTANGSALLDAAKSVARELNSLSEYGAQARAEADSEIAQGVETVNTALKQVQDLNKRIASIDRTSEQAATLMDERQRVLDTIAEFLPIQTVQRDAGTIDVLTTQGVYLINGSTARQIEFTPSSAFTSGQTLANGDLSGISVDGIDLTTGSTSFGAVSGGLFGALFTLRDQDVPAFMDQLDMVANDIITRLSDDAIDPTKTPGEQGLFVDPDAAGLSGLASRISVNAAVDPAQGGDIWRLRDGLGATASGPPGNSATLSAIYDAFTQVKSLNANGIQGAFSASDLAAQLSSVVGQKRVYQDSVLASTQAQHVTLVEAEQSLTGVDVDVEMESLLLIEQAYAANARVIQVARDMIGILMEL
ncbi:flagellar hook-associated protein FlgK [Hyphomonas neptunium ATCC 15444]|uniref:Flagellar hook-associated protein 1 n=2 Tax=Hyphomonas TaxID=85 RepID=Q0C5L3_HYPNA|nr:MULTISPECIES: flagellar hook-associated protein FlgK [Hyphomonas]ABI77175.1 flagellar hook-associated protein FlgK [Hyphomonas neptunium ATCC 15444]KCZ95408.1 flagellar hook-associated protein FlgK [Hyphomonas hirschiana VP5]